MIQNTLEVKKKDFISYFVKYLTQHVYIKAKSLALDFITENWEYNCHDTNNHSDVVSLAHKFNLILTAVKRIGYIEKFSKSTYVIIKPINFATLENRLVKMVNMKSIVIGAM